MNQTAQEYHRTLSAPIILHGYNFDGNRGCQALRLSTQTILDRYLPGVPRLHANLFRNTHPQFVETLPDHGAATSGCPIAKRFAPGQHWEIERRDHPLLYLWGLKAVGSSMFGMFPPMQIHKELSKCRCILAMGGDNWSFDYGIVSTLLLTSPFAKAVHLGTPSVVWGASIGPFSAKPYWEKRIASVLKRVDLLTVREPLTQAYLAELGIEHNVRMVSDPAFILPVEQPELPESIENALKAGALGLNLAPLMVRYSGQSPAQWIASAAEILAHTVKRVDMPIVLIPHVIHPPSVDPGNNDFTFMQDVREKLDSSLRERVFLYDAREHTSMQIKGVISRLRVFAGNRTHATIAALSTNVPTFCIGYSVKSRGINLDIFGHEHWVAHFSALTGERLAARIEDLLREEESVRKHLQEVIPAYTEKAWLNGVYLAEMLARKGS